MVSGEKGWYMKVQKVYLLQQSQSLGEYHPMPAQVLPAYKIAKAEPPRCLALKTRDGTCRLKVLSLRNSPYPRTCMCELASCPGHSQLFNVAREKKREGDQPILFRLLHTCKSVGTFLYTVFLVQCCKSGSGLGTRLGVSEVGGQRVNE